jgi:hypothetical protein
VEVAQAAGLVAAGDGAVGGGLQFALYLIAGCALFYWARGL